MISQKIPLCIFSREDDIHNFQYFPWFRKVEIAGWAEAGARFCDAGLRRRAGQEEDIPRPRGLRQPPRRHYSGPF
jgi:hypothetical protein